MLCLSKWIHGVLVLYKASAPGSLMLLGEYAVLHDKTAIVCAIDKRIEVTLSPRKDEHININSSLGHYCTSINAVVTEKPFEFVLNALKAKKLPSGCDITIHAEFSSDIGLGSSAAVSVALVTVLNQWLGQTHLTKEQLWQDVKAVILKTQGKGSGADIAASIYGGVIAFRHNPLFVTPLKQLPPICAVYSGKKTTTMKAIEIVKERHGKNPQQFEELFDAVDYLSHQAVDAINHKDWESLGHLFNEAQTFMDQLGVNNAILKDIIQTLRQQPHVLGAKISGSGLGDCAIGLAQVDDGIFPTDDEQKKLGVKQIPIVLSTKGVIASEH